MCRGGDGPDFRKPGFLEVTAIRLLPEGAQRDSIVAAGSAGRHASEVPPACGINCVGSVYSRDVWASDCRACHLQLSTMLLSFAKMKLSHERTNAKPLLKVRIAAQVDPSYPCAAHELTSVQTARNCHCESLPIIVVGLAGHVCMLTLCVTCHTCTPKP